MLRLVGNDNEIKLWVILDISIYIFLIRLIDM